MTEIVMPSIEPTLNAEAAASREWDVVVIGAGPAGALAATLLARHGLNTLLIERKSFPRYKICGACLNPQSQAVLRGVGLEHTASAGVPLTGFHLQSRGRTLFLDLPGSMSISRERFDAELVGAAIGAGASFLCGCSARVLPTTTKERPGINCRSRVRQNAGDPARARVLANAATVSRDTCSQAGSNAELKLLPVPFREIELKPDSAASQVVRAAVVVAADGLSHSCVSGLDGFLPTVEAASRIGAGALAFEAPSFYQPGRIYMSVGHGGYVGLVRLEDGRLNVAAALDAKYVRDCGSLAEAARRIVASAGFPEFETLSQNLASDWHGTPALTRSTYPLAAPRLFVIGDAAGYVEPFTGEGIAWALASAQSVAPLVQSASQRWDSLLERTWQSDWKQAVGRHQMWCRRLARLLRHPGTVATVTRIASTCPWLAGPVIRRLNQVPKSAVAPLPSSTTARKAG